MTTFASYVKQEGLHGLLAVWPRPSAEAWAYIAAFGAAQAAMQLYVPGKIVKGPVTPKGNVPIYVVRLVASQLIGQHLCWHAMQGPDKPGYPAGQWRAMLPAHYRRCPWQLLVSRATLLLTCQHTSQADSCSGMLGLACLTLAGCTCCLGRSWLP